jgi:hypothetical protein
MIKRGDIVFRRFKGGVRNNQPDDSVVGLVIKEHGTDSAISVNQYQVQFGQEEYARWYWAHDLEKIRFGKDNKNES